MQYITMTKSAGISARVTEATKDRLDDYAAASGIPKSEIIEAAINNYLDVIQDVTQNVTQDVTQDEQAASEYSVVADQRQLPQKMMPASEFSKRTDTSDLPVSDARQENQATAIADLIARIEKLEANTINQQQLDERLAIVMGLNLATNENAINQHQLDERLAMATAPLWDAIHDVTQDVIHDATQNAIQDVTQDVTQSTDDATQELPKDDPSIETSPAPIKDEATHPDDPFITIKNVIADQAKYWEEVAESSYKDQSLAITRFLISNGFKDDEYYIQPSYITKWRKGQISFPSTPKSKHYLASIVYQAAIMGNL